jgi:hypothetical protein
MTHPSSEVQNNMIFMGHQIPSCHGLVVRSLFILWKMLLSSQKLPYDHLLICTNITFQYPKIVLSYGSSCYDPISTSPVPKSHIFMSHNSSRYDSKSTSPVPKITFSCPKIHLDMTQHINFSCPKISSCFVP